MAFNPDKCKVIHFNTKRKPIPNTTAKYPLQHKEETYPKHHSKVLNTTDHAKYLGVTISSNLSWNKHIDNITKKAPCPTSYETLNPLAYKLHLSGPLSFSVRSTN